MKNFYLLETGNACVHIFNESGYTVAKNLKLNEAIIKMGKKTWFYNSLNEINELRRGNGIKPFKQTDVERL